MPTLLNFVLAGRTRLLQLAVLAMLVLAPSVRAYETAAKLEEVAHVYSLGVGQMRCASSAEWDADFASSAGWAYTNVRDDYTVLGPRVCAGALNVGTANVPLWQQALGALVLTHEAFHLRRWRFRRDEGKVECQAIVYFKDAAQRLGATPAQAENLYPYALALHAHQVRLFPRYRDRGCVIPPWAPPSESPAAIERASDQERGGESAPTSALSSSEPWAFRLGTVERGVVTPSRRRRT